MTTHKPVLIVGGSGFVGTYAARTLRKLHPALPLAIGGRNLDKADTVAREIGNAEALTIDLSRGDLGLPVGTSFSAVVMFVYDDTLNALQYALAKGVPYLSFSSSIHEIGPKVAHFANRPSAPVLMGASWLAGITSIVTAHFARQFRKVDSIEISSIFDEQDVGGPAADADFARLTASPNTMLLEDGRRRARQDHHQRRRTKDSSPDLFARRRLQPVGSDRSALGPLRLYLRRILRPPCWRAFLRRIRRRHRRRTPRRNGWPRPNRVRPSSGAGTGHGPCGIAGGRTPARPRRQGSTGARSPLPGDADRRGPRLATPRGDRRAHLQDGVVQPLRRDGRRHRRPFFAQCVAHCTQPTGIKPASCHRKSVFWGSPLPNLPL
ncbi:hypothetical protein C8K44_10590 [Aminobacter sp. AP02]|nr:hypothetical protein C8K44_10590 [Aminobacter sp. AP02]